VEKARAEERRVRREGPTGSPLGKKLIESDMILDGSDTIPGHVPVQRTHLRS